MGDPLRAGPPWWHVRLPGGPPASSGAGRAIAVRYNIGMTTQEAIILVAHGSRAPGTREAHLDLTADLANHLGHPVTAAFLELTEPDIATAIDAAVAGGARRVVLVPYFLHHGNHTRRDIPEIIEAATARHPGLSLAMTPPLGPDPRLLEISAERARDALLAR